MKSVLPILGVVMILAGIIFFFQGIGVLLLLNSPMTRVTFWAYVGVILVVVGLVLNVIWLRGRRRL